VTEDTSEKWAASEAAALLAAARADALDEARRRLTDDLVDELLRAARAIAPPAAATSSPPPRRDDAEGVWVYGVVDARLESPPSLTGVDGSHRVELLRGGGLAALVSAVPLDEFGADALQRGLEDLSRLEALARAHERVLDAALALGAVVPFRLCTIYESPEHVRAMLEQEGTELAATLDRLAGMAEWGVKGFVAAPAEPAGAQTHAAASGTDYLARKREARDAVESAQAREEALVATIHDELSAHAADAVLSRPHDRRLSGHDGDMVVNGSYLVAESQADAFRSLVESLSRRHEAEGIELECTGPWPAYHFVEAG